MAKNCIFDHSVNFLVNFLSEDFAQNFRKFHDLEKSGSKVKIFAVRLGFWNFWMIQKSEFFLLLQITQNGPIRENKWLKPKSGTFFWDFWMTLPLQWLEASRLSHFRQIFRNNFFCSKWLRMVQFAKKSGRNRNLRISPSHWDSGSQT